MAKKLVVPESTKDLPLAVVKQMIALSTSGFGLVAALAWNNVIKETVDGYIKPHLPQGSGILSLFIYAIIVTALAVLTTLNLTKLEKRLEKTVGKDKQAPPQT